MSCDLSSACWFIVLPWNKSVSTFHITCGRLNNGPQRFPWKLSINSATYQLVLWLWFYLGIMSHTTGYVTSFQIYSFASILLSFSVTLLSSTSYLKLITWQTNLFHIVNDQTPLLFQRCTGDFLISKLSGEEFLRL